MPLLRANQRAITDAVRTHRGGLLSMIAQKLRTQDEAEELAQDVFAELLEAYDFDELIESAGAWLYTIARNKILDRFRKDKTRAAWLQAASASSNAERRSGPRPDDESSCARLREQLAQALERLPEEQRAVFVKHELEGLSFQEIARENGVPVNTLLSRKRYAILRRPRNGPSPDGLSTRSLGHLSEEDRRMIREKIRERRQ